ncbi:MAG: bifunctional diguanylate cyclase/phosphodiesterase [Chloroflexota bacterium]|nr:bifunctional diguanylate cyclase/phosphodiesterase [Chloroflexota bacterium]
MSNRSTAQSSSVGTTREPHSGLALRLALALCACTLAAIIAYLLLGVAIPDMIVRAVVATVVSVGSCGWFLQSTIVGPLVASREELEDRYQAALADALTDQLTALGNHRAFQEELDRQVEHAQRYGAPLSLVLIDIDEFKSINDEKGHAQGDQALADFGRLVLAGLRRVDRPFRVGGDEFAILLPHTEAEGAWIVARRLLANALQPPRVELGRHPISFSAGVSALPGLADSRAQLYSQADAALYAAKRAGRTDVVVFDPATSVTETTNGSSAAISEVIARGQLRPVYQPIVALDGLRVLGYEGLIRPVAPAPFADPSALFAAAAESGHLVALDMTCIEMIVAGAGALTKDQFLSVNITPRTVESPEFSTASLLNILARHRFPANRLVLELTEREPLTEVDRVRRKLDDCRAAGIGLAADDLGAGNAGLRLLSELQFDILKVDLSLVQRSTPGAPSSAVIGSVVSYAARAGALVIGEGIERAEEVAQLAALGVSAGQGFFFGRPASLPSQTSAGQVLREAVADIAIVADHEIASPMSAWRQSIGLPTPVSS